MLLLSFYRAILCNAPGQEVWKQVIMSFVKRPKTNHEQKQQVMLDPRDSEEQ